MKVNKQQLITFTLATAIGGLLVVWLAPFFKKLPPRENM